MGVDSGMPDFRGDDVFILFNEYLLELFYHYQGFWKIFKPFSMKFSFTDCANPSFLHSHPKSFWGFYGYRLNLYRNTTPHLGFKHLLDICQMKNIVDSFVVTSNVDGHFQKSGK